MRRLKRCVSRFEACSVPLTFADQPAKTPKTTKLKLTTKTPATAEKKEKKKQSAKKGDKRKSKAAVDEDEDMADAPEEEEPPKQLDPAAQKKAREREGKHVHHADDCALTT
jgi:hypothetical protein